MLDQLLGFTFVVCVPSNSSNCYRDGIFQVFPNHIILVWLPCDTRHESGCHSSLGFQFFFGKLRYKL